MAIKPDSIALGAFALVGLGLYIAADRYGRGLKRRYFAGGWITFEEQNRFQLGEITNQNEDDFRVVWMGEPTPDRATFDEVERINLSGEPISRGRAEWLTRKQLQDRDAIVVWFPGAVKRASDGGGAGP